MKIMSQEPQPISEETVRELGEQLKRFAENGAAQNEVLKEIYAMIVRSTYKQMMFNSATLSAQSYIYEYRLGCSFKVTRWYWKRKLAKINERLKKVEQGIKSLRQENSEILK